MNRLLPFLICLLFFGVYFCHSLNRHHGYESNAFDLGIYTQSIYLYSEFQTPYSTLKQMNILADHFGPILAILSPIYRLFPDPVTLLFLQSLFVSLSGLPIYLIALDRLKNRWSASIITIGFLSSPGIFSAVFFDFHLATISVLPLSLILYCWHFKHWRWYWLTLFLSLLFKEDIPIFILGLGLYQFFTKHRRLGIYTSLFALISFYLIKYQIMPHLWAGAASGYIDSSVLPLDNPAALIYIFITNPKLILDQFFDVPVKMETFNTLYRQFGFLPILSPLSWLTVVPYLFLRYSSTMTQLWTNDWHHNANLIPFLAISTVYAVSRFRLSTKAINLLLLFTILTGGLNPFSPVWTLPQAINVHYPQFDYLSSLQQLPPAAAISAQSPLVPRLANRPKIYLYPEINDAEFIVLDSNLNTYPLTKDQLTQRIHQLAQSTEWKLYYQQGSLNVYQKLPAGSQK